jgi:hypothetical protein
MSKYNVLITINQYVEIEAETHEDAEMEAYRAFKHGEIEIDQRPIFICEAEDLIKEEPYTCPKFEPAQEEQEDKLSTWVKQVNKDIRENLA